jgi:phosphoserine phosphatase RsbU/P
MEPIAAPIVILDPDVGEARQIASWLSSAGLGAISTARTCDEAIFMLGSRSTSLLIIDELVSERSERRLLQHMVNHGHTVAPILVRLASDRSATRLVSSDPLTKEIIRKPLVDEDVVQRVGCAVHRQDLIIQFRQARDQSRGHLEAAQRMQIGLLPTSEQLQALQDECRVGVGALYRSGEAVGGDLWGIWPVGDGRFALAIVDFAGHGLSAALNTFRLHALLSEKTLPREDPTRMTTLLNERLHALLPRGQYATMVYLVVDPHRREVVWCCAGGPNPMIVSTDDHVELQGAGLPLGVRAEAKYQTRRATLPDAGMLCVFSDGLFESGAEMPDVPRDAIAQALTEAARQARDGHLEQAAQQAVVQLGLLRENFPCPNHSDDIMAICVAFAAP